MLAFSDLGLLYLLRHFAGRLYRTPKPVAGTTDFSQTSAHLRSWLSGVWA
jgi:hypothetical protein